MTTRFKTTGFETAEDVLAIDRLCIDLETAAGPRPVLDDVSLKIRQGETACLVGESGSGKSLTSLAIMGLLPPGVLKLRSGGITLEGTDLLSRTPRQLRNLRGDRMAMIFQEPMTALNPVMRVGDQIAEVLDTHARLKGAERRARVLDAMEQVHLPDIARIFRAYPHQLSGGQRQRVMIAMALILEPALLIADEPTTALDVTTQKQILSLIAEMQRVHGTAVLFITHDMGVVSEIADTVHVMRQGRLVETAPAERLFRAPEHNYTRALLARQSPAAAPNPPLRSSVCQGGRGAGASVRVGPPRLEPHASPPHVPRRARAVPRQRFGTLPSRPGRCHRGQTDETSRAAPRPWQPDPPGLEA